MAPSHTSTRDCSKDDFVWDKTELLVPAPAGVTTPQSDR